ncbi:PIF-3 [Buzura suppressaria nucleopolyhedrovirus]|uniref:PIF-3 n=1 Tax=Buzura suppressaria nuclear polyhedrosis virus TaxID=74320 RepID=W5VLB4_NPVBS|nr:PIF-3 [Buzura suppressaria nucleopolyhedrovirus]AHH82679.1 PIF-3 [Buzura suppressaria nucleopolyhedrovirus]AKN91063.1 PIF-3 [Buzura suppressaria nucleopolyhedrovirus]QYF10639.1 per os infectivity factor-3 [Buzura suppressaria nucleopolyhedrovirus]
MHFNSYYVGFLLFLIVLIILYNVLINSITRLIRVDKQDSENNSRNPMQFLFDQNGIVDCGHTKLPCVTDRQCTDNCVVQNAAGVMVCEKGFCSQRNPQIAGTRPDKFECDSDKGLINVFVASEFVVDQLCISLYRDLFDDLGEPRPYLCDLGGHLNVNLTTRQFSVDDCRCADGYIRMVFNQTALARSVPVCIPASRAALYKKIYNVAK